jgi:predicted PurR-regulated permease PerM
MEKNYLNEIIVGGVLLGLTILAALLLKPILMSIIFGFVLVFIFAPLYNWLHKRVKSKNGAAIIMTIFLIIVITVPLILAIPFVVNQALKIFTFAQQIDFVKIFETLLPSLTSSETVAAQIDSVLHNFITGLTSGMINSVSNFLINIPVTLLQLTVVIFTFFFVMRDKEEFIDYLKSVLPFHKEVQERLLKATKDVTISVLYGQVIIGFVQGLVAGLGFFLFGAPSALLFMILAIFAGVLPIVGPSIVWIPMSVYLLATGHNIASLGVVIFGIASIIVDNILRPIVIARRGMINPLLALLGTIGGLILFGILGLILGPLIIAYLLIFIEVYKNKRLNGLSGVLVKEG